MVTVTVKTSNQELAEFIVRTRFEDLSARVIEHAKLCLLDTVGCGLFGSTQRPVEIIREALARVDDTRSSALWGGSKRLSAPSATLVNGTAIHAFELDDLHPRSIVHAGSAVVPAVLAASEGRAVSGQEFLVSVVLGYEVAARVGMTMGADHLRRGWHPTGTHGTLGAAAGAARVRSLDGEQTANALGTAASMSAGLMAAQFESMVKRLHAGRAAQSGYYAAIFAEDGFVGIRDAFDADYGGYGATFSAAYSPEPLLDQLGARWEIENVGFKPYSCNGSCHPTVDILRELRATKGLSAEAVERIDVDVSTATKLHVGWPYRPGEVTTAQMNLPYIAAVTLADGDAFVEQFSESRIMDPLLAELASRVHVEADPSIDARGDSARHATTVRVTTRFGDVLESSREHAWGSVRVPMSEDEVRVKYRRLAAHALDSDAVARLEDAVGRLDEFADVRDFSALLCVASE